MRIDGSIPPTIPFHVARAYGAGAAPTPTRPAPAAGADRAEFAPVLAKVERAQAAPQAGRPSLDAVEASGARQLVAATVPGAVDFSGAQPRPSVAVAPTSAPAVVRDHDALPLYRAPWDKNAAAVAVQVGRSLDISG